MSSILNQTLFISARIWHEVSSKVDVSAMVLELNNAINLGKYGDQLRFFYFTFLIEKEQIHEPFLEYDKQNKVLELSLRVDYEKIAAGSMEEVDQLLKATYLEGIKRLSTIPDLIGFLSDQFFLDVKEIFSKL